MALYTQPRFWKHQPDAVISQANPVSTTLYTVLDTNKNVKLISIDANITWAVTQPTPLEVVITIDGNTIIHLVANPVSANNYEAQIAKHANEANQSLVALNNDRFMNLYKGKSVKVQIRITWAITQPTPLVCRIKWAKWI